MRVCTKCNADKRSTDFYKTSQKAGNGKRARICKECAKGAAKLHLAKGITPSRAAMMDGVDTSLLRLLEPEDG